VTEDYPRDWRDDTITGFEGASQTGLMDTSPEADAISILQRVRDGLLRLAPKSSSNEEDVAA
jgi:hypothetical protein